MVKTTIYLDEAMKDAIAAKAAGSGLSEAAVIRQAISLHVGAAPKPRGGVYSHPDSLSGRVDELLAEGFGQW